MLYNINCFEINSFYNIYYFLHLDLDRDDLDLDRDDLDRRFLDLDFDERLLRLPPIAGSPVAGSFPVVPVCGVPIGAGVPVGAATVAGVSSVAAGSSPPLYKDDLRLE